MKIKRTLPSIAQQKQFKERIMIDQDSDDQKMDTHIASHVRIKNKDEKKEADIIASKILNSKRKIFQKMDSNQEKSPNQGDPSMQLQDVVINRSLKQLQKQGYQKMNDKVVENCDLQNQDQQQREALKQKQKDNIQENRKQNQYQLKYSRKRNIFKTNKKFQSQNSVQSTNKEQSSVILQKLTNLQKIVNTLQDQISNSNINSNYPPQNNSFYHRQHSPNTHSFYEQQMRKRSISNSQSPIFSDKMKSTTKYQSKDPKLEVLEMEQIRRCQKLFNQNQKLYNQIQSSQNNRYSKTLNFQDFNLQDEEQGYSYHFNTLSGKSKDLISKQDSNLRSPFHLEQNNQSACFSCSNSKPLFSDLSETIKVKIPKSKMNTRRYSREKIF